MPQPVLSPRPVRRLTLAASAELGRFAHVAAASGLVRLGTDIAVIADDDMQLGLFSVADGRPGRLIRLLDGVLPPEAGARKKRKPDFEALVRLPPTLNAPHGALLALGSGSTPARCRGVRLDLDADGQLLPEPRIVDVAPLYERLGAIVPALNIEGATAATTEFRLFNRGNTSHPDNHILRFAFDEVAAGLARNEIDGIVPFDTRVLDLGKTRGVPFSVTDAALLADGRTVVSAVAEDTADSYADGACIGAVLGLLAADLSVERIWSLEQPHKIEGVAAERRGGEIDLLLVSDADAPEVAATLFAATIPA